MGEPADAGATDTGGDAVCWLDRVCPDCGAMRDAEPPAPCPRCGSGTPPA